MDVAAFSGDNFDPKDWINKALKSSDPTQNKEAAASSLVMKLQLMIAKLNSALEDQCAAVVQSVPRVIREAGQLEQEAGLLRDKLVAVRAEMESVECETRENMSTLVRMDTVKERLGATTRALQEADNWTSLDTQVEDAFDNDDLDTVADRLAGMQASLRLLHHVADYQERVAHLEQHRNRLEATLSPLLVTAFTSKDTEAALRLVNMFRTMERGKQLSKYYHKCVRAGLLQRWAEIVMDGEGDGAGEWLDVFYGELGSKLVEQQAWAELVFPDESSSKLMCELVTDVLGSMEPSQAFCMEAAVKLSGDTLALLGDLRDKTDKFLDSIVGVVNDAGEAKLRELGKVVYKPFTQYVANYEELEARAMTAEVSSWATEKKDTIDEIHNLATCVGRVASMVESAGVRCGHLTRGVGYPALARAVARGLDTHLDRYRRLMRRLEKRKVVVDDDWSVLQHCLSANQATGDLMLQLEQLEVTLSTSFLECCRQFLGPDSADLPLQQHHIFLLDSPSIISLSELFSAVSSNTGSATPLLQQSISLLSSTCSDLQKTTFSIMFHPISSQLELIPTLSTWAATTTGQGTLHTTDMPDFSFSPSEYITCVGEYLMTLPQHLEPYMSQDNAPLTRAFREAVFPGSSDTSGAAQQSPADFLLGCISSSTCTSYFSYISSIPTLNNNSSRQLAMDISYLGDILDDLGHPLTSDLSSTAVLLRLAMEKWREESGGHSNKVIAMVRQARGVSE
eukprot:TRINITY_DN16360_c0_g1_i1.p1 TRINITY_DN16360_c0_g1~~TRINITY_DN16360_c0_g1_i1.p1  ORF type:complete len:756 (-),score=324.33 TRINITY_DN16360_c0_g1_i1:133-2346(-)